LTEQEKDKVLDLIEDSGSRILSTVTKIVDPIVKRYVLNVSLVTFEGFSKATIREQIIDRCSSYFLSLNRRDRIPKSDIIKIIENIDGVDSVNVHFVSEANEARVDQDSEMVGIDEFGDIVIGTDEIPVIRGGWADSRGLFYYDTLEEKQPSSLNIEFKATSKLDIARKNFAKKIEEITG
jgi:copper chaperone CopZ